MHIVARYW